MSPLFKKSKKFKQKLFRHRYATECIIHTECVKECMRVREKYYRKVLSSSCKYKFVDKPIQVCANVYSIKLVKEEK
jgi:hypothetical protein